MRTADLKKNPTNELAVEGSVIDLQREINFPHIHIHLNTPLRKPLACIATAPLQQLPSYRLQLPAVLYDTRQ